MTVSAVNGIYQYTNTYQSQFFSSAISANSLNQLMQEYGVIQTGDEFSDIQALYDSMYGYYSNEINTQNAQQANSSSQAEGQNASSAGWASVMQEVGLTATGKLDDDYAKFTAQIQSLEESASNQQDKDEIEAFAGQATSYFVENNTSTAHSQSTTASGSDIIAAMNKTYVS